MTTPCAPDYERFVCIDPMTEADLPVVAETEQRACPHPWSLGNFRDSLTTGYPAFMLTSPPYATDPDQPRTTMGRTLLGYWVAMRGVDEMHLLNITVAPEHRRHGWARTMMQALAAQAMAEGLHWLWLEVRVSNLAAQALYNQMGFLTVGKRKQYYPTTAGQREDALVMSLNLRGQSPHTVTA